MDTLLARDLGLDQRVPDGAEATDDGAGPPVAEHTAAPGGASGTDGAGGTDGASPQPRRPKGPRRDFGQSGTPFNRQSPFYVGFVGAVGVLTAYAVVQAVGRLGTVITLLVISLFLTLSLNPLVEALTRRRLSRGWAVTVVFLGVLAVFTLVGWVVIPPVAEQGTELARNAPRLFDNLLANPWLQEVDHRYQLIQRVQEEVNRRFADGNLWAGVFGGVL
ncbi:MAG: AI-2E family transporter, partial [Dermatophilaceae bacterium]|nr:AI-2E family transporter [Dermatophilaceae bacterium]